MNCNRAQVINTRAQRPRTGPKGPNAVLAAHAEPAAISHDSRFRAHPESGFTLAEVLAALVFMAILIPVAIEGLSIASRSGEVAARKSEAALVAESVLNEMIVTTNWNSGLQNGNVRQGIHDFQYTVHNDPWNQDMNATTMRQLSVEVKYTAQGRDYSVRLATLVDSSPPQTQTTTATTTTGQ